MQEAHKTEPKGDSLVREIAKRESESQLPTKRDWVESAIWTERMLAALGNGVKVNTLLTVDFSQ